MTCALEIRDVSFSYAGSSDRVLDGVSLSLEEGAFCLLVGDTGSGKSTLLSLVKPQIAPEENPIQNPDNKLIVPQLGDLI